MVVSLQARLFDLDAQLVEAHQHSLDGVPRTLCSLHHLVDGQADGTSLKLCGEPRFVQFRKGQTGLKIRGTDGPIHSLGCLRADEKLVPLVKIQCRFSQLTILGNRAPGGRPSK